MSEINEIEEKDTVRQNVCARVLGGRQKFLGGSPFGLEDARRKTRSSNNARETLFFVRMPSWQQLSAPGLYRT